MPRTFQRLAIVLLLLLPQLATAAITAIQVNRVEPFAAGATFGSVGAYERVIGVARGELDPADPRNAGIVNLADAPRNARGRVEYETDFYLLRPVDPARGNRKHHLRRHQSRAQVPAALGARRTGAGGRRQQRAAFARRRRQRTPVPARLHDRVERLGCRRAAHQQRLAMNRAGRDQRRQADRAPDPRRTRLRHARRAGDARSG